MDEEKFNQKNISALIRNILTLRYIPQQETQLPILNYNDFVPSSTYNLELIENILKNSIISSTNDTKNISISLSGGVDSTLVLGLLRNTLPDIPIHAISIKFAESTDETNNAKKIADFFEAEHETLFLENYLLELPAAIGIIGLPFWDIHWYYMAKYAKTKSSFLASGDGGDELFGGYTFRYSKFLSLVDDTSNSSKNADLLLKKAGFRDYFEIIVGKEDITKLKPNPDPILYALNEMNFKNKSNETWMVGDTIYDVQAAKNANVTSIGIPQNHTYDDVKNLKPDLFFESMKGFYEYIKFL